MYYAPPISAQKIQEMHAKQDELMAGQLERQQQAMAAAQRMLIDSQMLASFPGFLMRKAKALVGYEGDGARPTDGTEPSEHRKSTVQAATVAVTAQRKGRSLMAALEAVNRQWQSDGKPHRFEVD